MSGFICIVNTNDLTVDVGLLNRLTQLMAYRGPDARSTWSSGFVGLGHAALCTDNGAHEQQPLSLDGEVWIAADARIDGRNDLQGKLKPSRAENAAETDDARLILHAYDKWGEACLAHLIGDFAFAIWDGRRQQLFCACDHFGVKPFYYAHVKNCLVLGNTLDAVRAHPSVSARLNDLAVADFLLFDYNQENETTTFKDVRRLPPAHSLSWSKQGLKTTRYWKPPVDGCIRYKRSGDYAEHYGELLERAVNDRVRTERVAIFMSGGLDSTSIAATAARINSGRAKPFSLRAFTAVYDKLMPDNERHYSGLAASALGIPVEYLALDEFGLYQDSERPEAVRPEPLNEPLLAVLIEQLGQVARHGRVLLTGHGGDAVFRLSQMSILSLQFCRLLLSSVRYGLSYRRVPRVGIRTGLKRLVRKGSGRWIPDYPCWINRELEKRLRLRERWDAIWSEPKPLHPVRPESHYSLEHPIWRFVFESSDPGATRFPIENRHPFFDVRLVTYLLALPNEIFFDKELVRASMRDRLPEAVRARPKTPLVDSPLRVLSDQFDALMRNFRPEARLAEYVDTTAIPRVADAADDGNGLWVNIRPLSLNNWFRHQSARTI